jgi:hypothetical protein
VADSSGLLDTVRRFAFPRFSGTDGERRAADAVQDALREAGLHIRREPFRTARHAVPRLRLFAHGALAAGIVSAGTVAADQPLAAALLGGAMLVLAASATRWKRSMESAFDVGAQVESANVVGIREAARPDAPIVVVMAHVDSKSTALPTFVTGLFTLLVVGFLGLGTAWCALAAAGLVPPPIAGPGSWIAALLLLATAVNPFGNASPGALDNASGIAVLLRCARELPADAALAGAHLQFVATGAEELGLAGAMRWIQSHGRELPVERTVLINVDSVGAGPDLLATDAGGRAPDGRRFRDVVQSAAEATGRKVRFAPFLPGAGVDSQPVSARGYATVTLLGGVFGTATLRMHTARDRVEALDVAGLEAAVEVVVAIARDVASRGSAARGMTARDVTARDAGSRNRGS